MSRSFMFELDRTGARIIALRLYNSADNQGGGDGIMMKAPIDMTAERVLDHISAIESQVRTGWGKMVRAAQQQQDRMDASKVT